MSEILGNGPSFKKNLLLESLFEGKCQKENLQFWFHFIEIEPPAGLTL